MKKKLLWIGDAVAQTGFARVTHNVLEHLREKWDVHVIGLNYQGDPHKYPYPIYPAMIGGDVWGFNRVVPICATIKPDVVLINNDPWNVAQYVRLVPQEIPSIAYMPVDAPNQRGREILPLTRAITYTKFGRKELVLGGYTGRCDVIPHGVDTNMYRPVPMDEARKELTLSEPLPADAFIVGNVNRNQPRKRLDLTIQAWTQWWNDMGQPKEAYLFLHCANKDQGWNITQLAQYYGIQRRFILTSPKMTSHFCLTEEHMKYVYASFSIQLSTTMGEGWGLTQHEGMACGVGQIVPEYSALAEWARGAVHYVPVSHYAATAEAINTIGAAPSVDDVVAALTAVYQSPDLRADLAARAYARATDPQYQWPKIAEQFDAILQETVSERRVVPAGVRQSQEAQ